MEGGGRIKRGPGSIQNCAPTSGIGGQQPVSGIGPALRDVSQQIPGKASVLLLMGWIRSAAFRLQDCANGPFPTLRRQCANCRYLYFSSSGLRTPTPGLTITWV